NFDNFAVLTLRGNDLKFGVLLTAIVNFLLIAAAVYFCLVMPMNKMIERRNRRLGIQPAEEEADPNTVLLTEIRDALTAGRIGTAATGAETGRHEAPGNTAL
ncbi:MscL family protein, partial [Pseudoclavibacter helvolus]